MTERYATWLSIMAGRDASVTALAALAVGVLLVSWGAGALLRRAPLPGIFGRAVAWAAERSLVVVTYAYIVFLAVHGPLG